ncbi:MAG: hypothetical protein AAGC88_13485 [Bacteroidota bacterium]
MIVVRPKVNTLFSIGVFLILIFSFFGVMVNQYLSYNRPPLYVSLLMVTSGALGFAILLKYLWNLKTISIGKEKFEVKYPVRFRTVTYSGKQMTRWKEEKIKTWGGNYAELSIHFEADKKLDLSQQEHTDYDKTINYLTKKYRKLKK